MSKKKKLTFQQFKKRVNQFLIELIKKKKNSIRKEQYLYIIFIDTINL